MSDEDKKKRQELYAQTRQDLLMRLLSNSEKYDGAILTLSLGALGVSITYIKDIVPANSADHIVCLITSWIFFGAAVIATMISFHTSQWGIRTQLKYAEEYYLNRKDEFLKRRNIFAIATTALNTLSAVLFVIAIGLTIYFVSSNLINSQKKEIFMTERKNIQEGAEIPSMQKAPVTKGAEIPSMQAVEPNGGIPLGQTIPAMQPATDNTSAPGTSGNNSASQKSTE